MNEIATVTALLFLAVGLAAVARRFAVPYPIVLTLGGLALGFLPALPRLELHPEVVLLVFLPPILYSTAVFTSFRDFRANLRPISLLAVGLVLTTTLVVGWVAHEVIRGLPWAAAFALGAIVSPPDAVAATAITRRLGVPRRIVTILEGESLVNDATALVAYRMAVAALATGAFSWGGAAARFLIVAAGGVAVGLVAGVVAAWVRRRVDDPPAQITLSLLTPYAAYLPAESIHVSGVLAVVTTGLFIGAARLQISPSTRLSALAVWEVVVFLLNAFIFVLIGLQLPEILAGVRDAGFVAPLGYAAVVSATVIVVRFLWVFPATYLPRFFSARLRARDPYPSWRYVTIIAYTGMRGVVSLAAAFALPRDFPGRDLILFLTFAVIVATLVIEGLALPRLIRALHVADPEAERREEREARLQATRAALGRLDELARSDGHDRDLVDRLRWRYDRRDRRLSIAPEMPEEEGCAQFSGTYERLRRELLAREREVVRQMRDDGVIGDEVMSRIDRELDLEESRVET